MKQTEKGYPVSIPALSPPFLRFTPSTQDTCIFLLESCDLPKSAGKVRESERTLIGFASVY